MVCNRQDHDLFGGHPVRDRVWEAAKHVTVRSLADGPPLRRAKNQIDSLLDIRREPTTQPFPRLLVPESPVAKIIARRA